MLNWTRIPDLVCAVLMIWTFGAVSRDQKTLTTRSWMLGWTMILVHSIAALFTHLPGAWGRLDYTVFSVALVASALLFSHPFMPQDDRPSSLILLGSLGAATVVYMATLCFASGVPWALNLAAVLVTVFPLTALLLTVRRASHWRRWAVAAFCASLSVILLLVQIRRPYGVGIAWNAFLFVVILGSCFAAFTARRATAGASVTICGLFAWAMVFVLEPMRQLLWPRIPVESEIWHLPAFVVAVGMLLILLEDQLLQSRYLAWHDELTGLPNRRLFQDRLDTALARARRSGDSLALLSIDLDQFKQVNDTLGHQAGDNLLRQVSALFASRLRSSDTVARTGGDEFTVILENLATREAAEAVGQSLRALLSQPVQIGDLSIRVGASIGVALFPQDGNTSDALCRAADLRMYAVKHGIEPPPEEHDASSRISRANSILPSLGMPAIDSAAFSKDSD